MLYHARETNLKNTLSRTYAVLSIELTINSSHIDFDFLTHHLHANVPA